MIVSWAIENNLVYFLGLFWLINDYDSFLVISTGWVYDYDSFLGY